MLASFLLIAWFGAVYTLKAAEQTSAALQIPMSIPFGVIPLAALIFVLHVLADMVRSLGSGQPMIVVLLFALLFLFIALGLPIALSIGLPAIGLMLTPPVGICLFVSCGISGLPLGQVSRAVLPFLAVAMAALLISCFWPPVTLWLPSLIYR